MKKILLIVMMLVMCVSSACFASDGSVLDADGSVLDAEAKMVDQFLNASSYKNVSSILSADMKDNFDETKFNEYKASITNDLGAYKEKQLVNLIKRPGVDRVVYGAGFEKGQVMMVIADFAVDSKEKPLLLNIAIVPPQPANEEGNAEQK